MVWQWYMAVKYENIDQLPGKTPREKYKNLNKIVKKISNAPENQEDSSTIEIDPSLEIPKKLIPLVQFEVAKILKHPKKMMTVIHNTKQLIVKALGCSWYLNEAVENNTCLGYMNEIWPTMSSASRNKVIYILAKNLNPQNPRVAEEFYEMLLRKSYNFYEGSREVEPLLLACSEPFIWKKIENYSYLSSWTAKRLYARHPKIILQYLTLKYENLECQILDKYYARDLTKDLQKCLPHALKHFPTYFIKIMLIHQTNFDLKLNFQNSLYFLQQPEGLKALSEHVEIFFPMLSRKVFLKKLTEDRITLILIKFFPSNPKKFKYSTETVLRHFEHFPQEYGVLLFLSIFKKCYGVNYFEFDGDILSYEIIRRLAEEKRVEIARKKVESGQKFHFTDVKCSWACYLPITESIPMIKNEFNDASDQSVKLLESLIYTCHINKDKKALLEALSDITARHENVNDMSSFFALFNNLFQSLGDLTLDHWNHVLALFTKLNCSNQLANLNEIIRGEFVLKKIFLNLIQDLPADGDVNLFIDISVEQPPYSWSLLQDQPLHLQKKCLDLIINAASSIPDQVRNQKEGWLKLISNILDNIYELNKRLKDSKTLEDEKLVLISAKNYSWLCDEVVIIFTKPNARYHRKYIKIIKTILKKNDRELLATWLEDEQTIADLYWEDVLRLLRKNHEKIVENWEIYYEKCRKYINFYSTIYFIDSCRLYDDISRKFEERALQNLSQDEESKILSALGRQTNVSHFKNDFNMN